MNLGHQTSTGFSFLRTTFDKTLEVMTLTRSIIKKLLVILCKDGVWVRFKIGISSTILNRGYAYNPLGYEESTADNYADWVLFTNGDGKIHLDVENFRFLEESVIFCCYENPQLRKLILNKGFGGISTMTDSTGCSLYYGTLPVGVWEETKPTSTKIDSKPLTDADRVRRIRNSAEFTYWINKQNMKTESLNILSALDKNKRNDKYTLEEITAPNFLKLKDRSATWCLTHPVNVMRSEEAVQKHTQASNDQVACSNCGKVVNENTFKRHLRKCRFNWQIVRGNFPLKNPLILQNKTKKN